MRIDVFNGDADGLCARQQWGLAHPGESRLVTGVKRDVGLLAQVQAGTGLEVAVFDVSLDANRADLIRLVQAGAAVRYFDHHFAGEVPLLAGLEATLDPSPEVCTSLLVDRALSGRFRAWAVVGAFGDNLREGALGAAATLGVSPAELELLAELGELLNYNGYGDTLADLHFAPAALARELAPHHDPLEFVRTSPAFLSLRAGFAEDLRLAGALAPALETEGCAAFVLPDAPWARRVIGVMANRAASRDRRRAFALLVPNAAGDLTVSVRAPRDRPTGADTLCRGFSTGGGRQAAAGINHLPSPLLDAFLQAFARAFP